MVNDAYVKNFDSWNLCKKQVDGRNKLIGFKEREVWFASIGINIGHEQDGKNELFERPVLVLKRYNKDMLMAVPLSTKIKDSKHYVPYLFENRMYSAVISQVRLIDSRRLLRKIYTLPMESYIQIKQQFVAQFLDKKSDPAGAESSEPESYSSSIVAKRNRVVKPPRVDSARKEQT
jgi:mRNA interferase MazF